MAGLPSLFVKRLAFDANIRNAWMSSPCPKHPSHPLVGVCASCLREKLGAFVDSEEEEGGGGGSGGDSRSSGSSPIINIAIDNGSYMHDSPTKMGASVAANELQAPAMETNTCPQVGFPPLTRSLSFNEISAKLSPISTAQKRTLSYYLDLYNNEGASSACTTHSGTKSGERVDHHSPLCASSNAAHGGNEEKKHGSLSFRGLKNPMIVACESGPPLSWLSALFSRRREKQKAKSKHSWRGCSSGGRCEGVYDSSSSISWEAPRPSSCREQLSSWEEPTTSSWQLPLIQNSHPTRASEADHNPTIASQAELNQRIGHRFAVETKPKPHWNEVWTKTLLSNKWAIKLKSGLNKKSQQPGADSDDDHPSTVSAASSSARETSHQHHSQNHSSVQNHSRRTQQNSMSKRQIKTSQDEAHHSQREFGSSRRDYGAWDFYYGPVQSTGFESNHKSNSARSGESGLLRFYLTPVRGTGFRGKGKQRAHYH